nr:MAG: DNA pilot protein [Microvirus sp.]
MEFLGHIASGIGNYLGARNINRVNARIARQTNDLNYQRQLEFFNMTNAYNHPKAVMQRYRDAGINPQLVAGHMYGGLASSPVFRAEAAISRNPSSVSNPVSHIFNTLGNILKSVYAAHMKDEELNRKEKEADIGRKNAETVSKVAATLSNANGTPPSLRPLTWKQLFKNVGHGLVTPQNYVNAWDRVVNKFFDRARPSYISSRTVYDDGAVRTMRRVRMF